MNLEILDQFRRGWDRMDIGMVIKFTCLAVREGCNNGYSGSRQTGVRYLSPKIRWLSKQEDGDEVKSITKMECYQ